MKYIAPPKKNPRILFVDIETTPLIVDVWDTGKQYVSYDQILKDRSVLSWAGKWYGKKEIMYADTRTRRDKRDDKKIMEWVHRLMCEADVIVGQNSKRFDVKILNARFAKHGLGEPDSYQSVDIMQIVKGKLKLPSYSLGYMTEYFGIPGKYVQRPEGYNGRALWRKCEAGDRRAFEIMEKYNKTDVYPTLELVWEKVRAWASGVNYVNPNLYMPVTKDGELEADYMCQCGSTEFVRNGYTTTSAGRFLRWKCSRCGSNHREKGIGANLRPQKRGRV